MKICDSSFNSFEQCVMEISCHQLSMQNIFRYLKNDEQRKTIREQFDVRRELQLARAAEKRKRKLEKKLML